MFDDCQLRDLTQCEKVEVCQQIAFGYLKVLASDDPRTDIPCDGSSRSLRSPFAGPGAEMRGRPALLVLTIVIGIFNGCFWGHFNTQCGTH
jgi:hypothetical protein